MSKELKIGDMITMSATQMRGDSMLVLCTRDVTPNKPYRVTDVNVHMEDDDRPDLQFKDDVGDDVRLLQEQVTLVA